VQPRFTVRVLALEPQILFKLIDGQILYFAPRAIRCLPDDLTFGIRQF